MLPLANEMLTVNGPGIHIMHDAEIIGGTSAHRVWTITDGPILVLAIWGRCTDAMNASGGTTLQFTHSLGAGPPVFCGVLADCASDPEETYYFLTGVAATAMLKCEPLVGGTAAIAAANMTPVPAYEGDIDLTAATNANTGSAEWHLVYRPLTTIAYVVNGVYD